MITTAPLTFLQFNDKTLIFTIFIPEKAATTFASSTEAPPTATNIYAATKHTDSAGKFKDEHRVPLLMIHNW